MSSIKNVYLAGRFSRKDELACYAQDLERNGFVVTSRWLTGAHDGTTTNEADIPMDELATFAREDMEDIDRADMLIAFTEDPGSGPARGGRHVEAGYALAKGKMLVVVGARENVFYCLPNVLRYSNWDFALRALAGKEAANVQP